jgi:hypothetical protein
MANTLSYYDPATITTGEFYSTGACTIKLFTAVIIAVS